MVGEGRGMVENLLSVKQDGGRHQWLKCKIRGGGTLHSGLGP